MSELLIYQYEHKPYSGIVITEVLGIKWIFRAAYQFQEQAESFYIE